MRPPKRRVGVNLLWLVPGVVGGTEEAACGFLEEVARLAPDDLELLLYVQPSFAEAHPALAAAFPRRTLPFEARNRIVRVLTEVVWLGVRSRLDRLDLVHHYGGVVPPLAAAPSVVTVHDVQPLVFPENFGFLKRRWLHRMLPRSVRVARLVIVPSLAAKGSVVDLTGISESRIREVWHGVSLRHPAHPSTEDRARVRSAYRLSGPFVLYPAITYPHKQHVALLEAFARLAQRHPDVVLVLAGGAAGSEADVLAAIERLGLGDRVRRVGRIPRDDLDTLLLEASLVAFPSTFEGFGLPLIEAMAAGCPVVANSASAMPEVVGDAGVLVPTEDPEAFAAAMALVLDDPARRDELVARGRVRVLRFAWRELASSVIDVYREALGMPLVGCVHAPADPSEPHGSSPRPPDAPGAELHQEAAS